MMYHPVRLQVVALEIMDEQHDVRNSNAGAHNVERAAVKGAERFEWDSLWASNVMLVHKSLLNKREHHNEEYQLSWFNCRWRQRRGPGEHLDRV